MAYTIGARHVLTGSGQFAISAPVGLRISIANVPRGISEQFGAVPTYATLGHLTLGNSDGWRPAINLRHTSQLEYPLPDSLTLLGYDLVAGATATVDELVAVAVPGPLAMPWDRAPAVALFNGGLDIGGNTSGTIWTYTVPVNHKLWIDSAELTLVRTGAASGNTWTVVTLLRSGYSLLAINEATQPLGFRDRASLSGSGVVLFSGETLTATYSCGDAGGNHRLTAIANGYTFDA